jgi:hypothetical protein
LLRGQRQNGVIPRTKLVYKSRNHSGQMDILDEQGRIFGRVNIIDALVVLFALAVIVAGAALVFGGGGTDDQPAQTPTPTPEPDEPPERDDEP